MVRVDLGYCPQCGNKLEECDPPRVHRMHCSTCGDVIYNSPAPVVVATVVDGDSALFVKRARAPEKGCWSMPGGYMEMGERPRDGAARELTEETGISVDPEDLKFVGTDYEPIDENSGVVSIIFAAPSSRANGEPVAGDDAEAVRYWSRDEIAQNPFELRAGDVTPILWAIDTLGKADDAPLW